MHPRLAGVRRCAGRPHAPLAAALALHMPVPPALPRTGFPLREAPQAVLGFTEVQGQAIAGADFPCPMSVLPDKCAYRKLLDAATMCVDALQCTAVVWFFNGEADPRQRCGMRRGVRQAGRQGTACLGMHASMSCSTLHSVLACWSTHSWLHASHLLHAFSAGTDGCSEPVAVLKSEGLSPDNTFVAPRVTTLQQESLEERGRPQGCACGAAQGVLRLLRLCKMPELGHDRLQPLARNSPSRYRPHFWGAGGQRAGRELAALPARWPGLSLLVNHSACSPL